MRGNKVFVLLFAAIVCIKLASAQTIFVSHAADLTGKIAFYYLCFKEDTNSEFYTYCGSLPVSETNFPIKLENYRHDGYFALVAVGKNGSWSRFSEPTYFNPTNWQYLTDTNLPATPAKPTIHR